MLKVLNQKNALRTVALSTVGALALAMATPISTMALETRAVQTNGNKNVSATEIKNALRGIDGLLQQADQTKTTTDGDSALKAARAGAQIDIPKDISDGVAINSIGVPSLDITLPNADNADDAKKVAAGTVAYAGNNGSANAVQATEDGGVRMLTIIDRSDAPTTYDYGVSVPDNGDIVITKDGGANILGSNSEVIATVATPWAKDALGKTIHTYFSTDGTTLTQHIEHDIPGVVYPVTADPIWFAVSAAVFWWAVQRCGAGGIIGAVFEYVGGGRSRRAIAAAGAAGCIASFVGGWGILKNMVRIVKW
ncbi:MAG TPA: hypothetical protein VFT16_00800 [Candidatus Saccharimonadales bacterium]|nr:hypothetical protein [Candidatus Saccharimonadales bacterium]